MTFIKYPSLENSYNQKFINIVGNSNPLPEQQWYALEKIHGANFSFISDGKTVSCAKRSGPISENETFYNWVVVYEREREAVLKLFEIIRFVLSYESPDKHLQKIQVFGEIYGGNSWAENKSKYSQIQTGVVYSTDILFSPFDILINGEYFINDHEKGWLDYLFVLTILNHAGFSNVIDNYQVFPDLNSALAISPVFKSRINPSVDGENNAEGYVIRPAWDYRLPNDSHAIIKHKNPDFSEKNKNREPKKFIDYQKFLDENPEINDRLQDLISNVTLARLQSVASKEGYTEMRHFGNLLKDTIQDIFADFNKENPDWLTSQDDKVKNIFGKTLATEVREEIKKSGILG